MMFIFLAFIQIVFCADYPPHTLADPEKNEQPIFSERLCGECVTGARIEQMAALLNEKLPDGRLNGHYYESGGEKDAAWIEKKKKLLLSNFVKGYVSCRFFYEKDNPDKLICFVGAELNYLDNLEIGEDPLFIFWGTSVSAQGKGYTKEAIQAFVKQDLLRDRAFTSVIASIHPDNSGSMHLAESALGAVKTKETWNYTRTQPRYFYEVSRFKLEHP